MAGTFKAVHISVRQPGQQITQVAVGEDRILRPPHHERGHVQGADISRYGVQSSPRWVLGCGWDIGHKVPYTCPAGHCCVGCHERGTDVRRQRRLRQGVRHTQECGGGCGTPLVHSRVQGKLQRWRQGKTCGVHCGVCQDNGGELLPVPGGPAEGDDPTPVVTHADNRPGQGEGVSKVTQVSNSVLEAAKSACPLGEAHIQLVNGNDAPGTASGKGGRGGCPGQQGAPQIGPGGVAVHAQQRAHRLQTGG